jgi:hypothetical protein
MSKNESPFFSWPDFLADTRVRLHAPFFLTPRRGARYKLRHNPMATTKNCKACGSPIPQRAKLCPVCQTYQSRWRAFFHFFSSSTPLWVAAASLVWWAISQWPTVRILFWPREDVQVVAADPHCSAVIVNSGDYEVFVVHIMLYMTDRTRNWVAEIPVFMSVASGKFLQVPAARKDDFQDVFWVRSVTDGMWEKFVDQPYSDKQCFQILLFAVNDPAFQAVVAAAPTTNRIAAGGYIEYRTLTVPTYTRTPVPATGVIQARSTPECEKKVTAVGGR